MKHLNGIIYYRLLVSTLFMFSIQGLAQTPNQSTSANQTKNDPDIIRCPVYITKVRVRVSDRTGKELSDLKVDDFVVYEDDVRQEIVYWTSEINSDTEGKLPGYEMAYYPSKYPFDGKYRRLRVVVNAKGRHKLRVEFSPKGYFANKELLK